jgi:hypothetical protein
MWSPHAHALRREARIEVVNAFGSNRWVEA